MYIIFLSIHCNLYIYIYMSEFTHQLQMLLMCEFTNTAHRHVLNEVMLECLNYAADFSYQGSRVLEILKSL